MQMTAQVFMWLAFVVGSIALFTALLWGLAWLLARILQALKIWHVLCLAVSIRLHGKEHADSQFWWAISEKASRSRWSAKNIADYAMEHAPPEKTP